MRRIAAAVAIVVMTVGGYQLTQVDWAAYGEAEPPDESETIDSSLVTLRSVQLGNFDALTETPSFTWSQYVDVHIEADCVPGRFQISNSKRAFGAARKNPELLRASLGLQIVRRSSLGDGRSLASASLSGAKVNRNNKMTWTNRIWIPHVPGSYRVSVILQRTSRRVSRDVRITFEPIVIGTFNLDVRPGKPAD